jgi:hypothetical protein
MATKRGKRGGKGRKAAKAKAPRAEAERVRTPPSITFHPRREASRNRGTR